MKFWRFLIFLILSIFVINYCQAFKNEQLKYIISYKWGLIHKEAGDAVLSLADKGNAYEVSLTARTRPWADKIYMVRDTLLGSIRKNGFKPLSYSKIAHEKGKYSRDDIVYEHNGDTVAGKVTRIKQNKKGEISREAKRLNGSGDVFDMLTVFYFLRNIDYNSLKKGERREATIFSGSKAETLTIKYEGKEEIKLSDGSLRDSYHIKFSFTSGKNKKSSEDMDSWISTDSNHIPLLVTGSLPIGQVRCTYVP